MKVSIIIPAYNEQDRIGGTIAAATKYLEDKNHDYEIVVVNDGSADGTVSVVKEIMGKNQRIRLVNNGQNQGKGHAVREGMLLAKGEARLFMDADGSTQMDSFEELYERLKKGQKIVVGSRRVAGSVIKNDQPWHRLVLGWIFRQTVKTVTKIDVIDSQNGFKMFHAEVVDKIFPLVSVKGWAFDVEVLAIGKCLGYDFVEIPVIWQNDHRSKITFKGMCGMLVDLVVIAFKLQSGVYHRFRDKLRRMESGTKRILGIDYGNKRVGIAVSDEAVKFALPSAVLQNSPNLLREILEIAKKQNVQKIVLGKSTDFEGRPNAIFAKSEDLKKALEENGYEVIFEPEFLSSVQASRWQGKTDKLDASAAAIILQSYLDKQ